MFFYSNKGGIFLICFLNGYCGVLWRVMVWNYGGYMVDGGVMVVLLCMNMRYLCIFMHYFAYFMYVFGQYMYIALNPLLSSTYDKNLSFII